MKIQCRRHKNGVLDLACRSWENYECSTSHVRTIIRNIDFRSKINKKQAHGHHHIVDESCCVHRPHVDGTSTREALSGAKQAGGYVRA